MYSSNPPVLYCGGTRFEYGAVYLWFSAVVTVISEMIHDLFILHYLLCVITLSKRKILLKVIWRDSITTPSKIFIATKTNAYFFDSLIIVYQLLSVTSDGGLFVNGGLE
jgi:hypothetical protein